MSSGSRNRVLRSWAKPVAQAKREAMPRPLPGRAGIEHVPDGKEAECRQPQIGDLNSESLMNNSRFAAK
jgi:hypothetical protein